MVDLRVVDPASPSARWAMGRYFDELAEQFGFEVGTALDDAATTYAAPHGCFVLIGPDDAPLGCGAVRFLDEDRGEIKRMWISPHARGQGLARVLLAHLETLIRESGRREALLDTNSTLTSAVALYTSSGYRPVPDYNANPDADVWFAKSLA